MREMMRSTDRAMSNIESHPEGFNALRRMYRCVRQRGTALEEARREDGAQSAAWGGT